MRRVASGATAQCASLIAPYAGSRPGSPRVAALRVVVGFADVVLSVELETELGDEIELRLEIIDVLFLVVHELLEQVAGDVILDRMAMRGGFLVERPRRHLRRKIAVEHLSDVLPDAKRIDHLHVGKAVEEDDALNDLVRMLHLLDRFLAPFLGQRPVTPIVQQPVMQPVLVDGGKLVPQTTVEKLDDSCIALHGAPQNGRDLCSARDDAPKTGRTTSADIRRTTSAVIPS